MSDTNKIEALSILKGLLSKAYKLDDGKITELFEAEGATTESVLKSLEDLDVQRVSTLKKQNADNKDSFNQGYAKAKKEERSKFEEEIKEALEIDSDNTGLELINDIIAAKGTGGGKGTQLTDEDVKKHSVYQAMERTFKKQLKEANDNHIAKVRELETAHAANETFYGVRDMATTLLNGLNPVISKNAKVAGTIQSQFFNELKSYGYEKQADGTYLPTKEGKVITDSHGHTVTFDDLVKGVAENYYEFQANNGGQNAGNQNQGGQQGGAGAAKTFKSDAEAAAYANDASIPIADRMAAVKSYNDSKTAQ